MKLIEVLNKNGDRISSVEVWKGPRLLEAITTFMELPDTMEWLLTGDNVYRFPFEYEVAFQDGDMIALDQDSVTYHLRCFEWSLIDFSK